MALACISKMTKSKIEEVSTNGWKGRIRYYSKEKDNKSCVKHDLNLLSLFYFPFILNLKVTGVMQIKHKMSLFLR